MHKSSHLGRHDVWNTHAAQKYGSSAKLGHLKWTVPAGRERANVIQFCASLKQYAHNSLDLQNINYNVLL